MSRPNAYTVQLTKKAGGALQMKLMIPGYEMITMQPKELRDVAAGIEAMFAEAPSSVSQAPTVEALEKCVTSAQQQMMGLMDLVQKYIERTHALDARVRAVEYKSGAHSAQMQGYPNLGQYIQGASYQNQCATASTSRTQHAATCRGNGPAESCLCQTIKTSGQVR